MVGSSDPYVIATIGDRTVQTGVVKNSLSPEWNENFEISLATKPAAVTDTHAHSTSILIPYCLLLWNIYIDCAEVYGS